MTERERGREKRKQTSKQLPPNNGGEFDLNENETFQHRIAPNLVCYIAYACQCPSNAINRFVFLIQNHFDEHRVDG